MLLRFVRKTAKKGFLFPIVDVTKDQNELNKSLMMCVYVYVCSSCYQIILYSLLGFFMIYILPIVFTYIRTHIKDSFLVLFLSSRKILCFHRSISVFIQTKKNNKKFVKR